MWFFGRKPQKDFAPLRAYYLHHECDLSIGIPSEDDFQAWLAHECDPDDAAYYEDLGSIAIARTHDDEHDVWDWLGMSEGRSVWHTYQRANQGWGVLQWAGRVYGWFIGLPWF
jgi:hypothetical protein